MRPVAPPSFLLAVLFSSFLFSACEKEAAREVTRKVYVTLQGSDQVAVLDGNEGKLLRKIDLHTVAGHHSSHMPHFIAIDDVGKKWYVSLIHSGIIAKFDLESDELEDTLFVGDQPALLALSPDGSELYVSRFMPMEGMGGGEGSVVQKVMTDGMTLVGGVDVGASSPHAITYNSADDHIWTASFTSSCLFRIDASRFEDSQYSPEGIGIATEEEQLAGAPGCASFPDNWAKALQLSASPDGDAIYLSLSGRDQVRQYDVAGSLVATYDVGTMPWHLVADNDGGFYVLNLADNTISHKKGGSDPSIGTITSDKFDMPQGLDISGDGEALYVSSSAAGSEGMGYLHIIDTATDHVVESIPLGEGVVATGVAVTKLPCEACE